MPWCFLRALLVCYKINVKTSRGTKNLSNQNVCLKECTWDKTCATHPLETAHYYG